MGAPQNLSIEHSRKMYICAVTGAASDFIGAVMTNGPGPDHVEFLIGKNDIGFRFSYHL
jgi:hypothetical protein